MAQRPSGLQVPTDPRLDRQVQFDERSRNFPIRTLVEDKVPRSYTWACAAYLDQGSEGACVGFSIAHEIAARPKVSPVSVDLAYALYDRARVLDEWPGENYDGTSIIAGVQAAQEDGYFGTYRWGFGLQDLILAVGYRGPAILGINWYEAMLDTDADGYVRVGGDVAGGHAILCRGVSVRYQRFLLHNSWGLNWGRSGTAYLSFDDAERLLDEQGEACIPEQRFLVAA